MAFLPRRPRGASAGGGARGVGGEPLCGDTAAFKTTSVYLEIPSQPPEKKH